MTIEDTDAPPPMLQRYDLPALHHPCRVPITPDLPYDTPITSTPAPLTTEREDTRLPPSEPHVMPNPAHPVKVEQEPTSTPPTTTSPTVEASQNLHISPTRTSSIAGLGSILATLKLQNSVPNMSTPTSTEPAPEPAPPTQPAPPVPTPPLPTNLTSPSSEVVLPTETQTISNAPEGSTSHLNEQRTMWDECVELLADVLQKREALVTLDASRAFYGRLAATVNSFDAVIERSRFKAESVGFGLKRMAKEKEYNEAMDKLLGSEAWRLLRLESANDAEANTAPKRLKIDGDAKKMLADIQATIVTVKDAVKELHGFVQDIGTKQNIAVPVPPGTSPILPAPNQDAEMEAASPKAQADTSLDQTNDEDVPRSLSGFYDGLKAVEDRLIDIESNLAQRQEEIGEEIQSDLESQFNDLKILVEEQAHNPILSQAKELCESNAKRVTTVEGDVSKTGYEIDELANEVVEAIGRTNEVVRGNEHLAQENAWLRHENERLQRSLEEMEHRQKAELALMRAETDEAKALLQEYLSRPPPPTMPPSDELLVSILPAVQQALHPLFAELHGVIQGLLTSKVTALNSSVQSTVHRLLHMISTFEEWADHVRDGVDPGYLLRRAPVQGPRQ
ncbi:hypothetical protein QCA50_011816 [Cerrena zonata]|uniref:Uncharacterized protein n=1 Tax=Cerrena zonata TaxID=2478898 RepID=A0AAW0FVS2_9APHY